MKKIYCFLTCLFIFINTSIYPSNRTKWDNSSDQKIKNCFHSNTFQNISLRYYYNNRKRELRIIFNPEKKEIELKNGNRSMFQFYYGVFFRDVVSEELKTHLEDIIINILGSSSGGFWSMGSKLNGISTIDYFDKATAKDSSKKQIEPFQKENVMDQKIYDLFKKETFVKLSLNYPFEGKIYPIHLIYNPKREYLLADDLKKPVKWPFAMTIAASSYPLSLARHLKSLVPDELLKDPESVIDVADWITYYRKYPVFVYDSLHPILLLKFIENPDVDCEIQNLFKSKQLEKKHLCYELDNEFYKVLLIHNPKKINLKSTLKFNTFRNGTLKYTLSWNSKIGIFVDKKAPKELIDHFSNLYALSFWDNLLNISASIHNGDRKEIYYYNYPYEYTYTPYTWYTFMMNAKP